MKHTEMAKIWCKHKRMEKKTDQQLENQYITQTHGCKMLGLVFMSILAGWQESPRGDVVGGGSPRMPPLHIPYCDTKQLR